MHFTRLVTSRGGERTHRPWTLCKQKCTMHSATSTLKWASICSPQMPLPVGNLDPHLIQVSFGPFKTALPQTTFWTAYCKTAYKVVRCEKSHDAMKSHGTLNTAGVWMGLKLTTRCNGWRAVQTLGQSSKGKYPINLRYEIGLPVIGIMIVEIATVGIAVVGTAIVGIATCTRHKPAAWKGASMPHWHVPSKKAPAKIIHCAYPPPES